MKPKLISRVEYKAMLDAGRTFRGACLYEVADYAVDFGNGLVYVKKETTVKDS